MPMTPMTMTPVTDEQGQELEESEMAGQNGVAS